MKRKRLRPVTCSSHVGVYIIRSSRYSSHLESPVRTILMKIFSLNLNDKCPAVESPTDEATKSVIN